MNPRVTYAVVLLAACARPTTTAPCHEPPPAGSVTDSLYAQPTDSIPPFNGGASWSELRHTASRIPYVVVSGKGPLRLGSGSSNGQPNGCMQLPALRVDAGRPGEDATDGSCPVVHIGAILATVRRRMAVEHIDIGLDFLEDSTTGAEIWALVVYDWRHFDRVVGSLDILGTYGIDAKIAVAVEPPISCVRNLASAR